MGAEEVCCAARVLHRRGWSLPAPPRQAVRHRLPGDRSTAGVPDLAPAARLRLDEAARRGRRYATHREVVRSLPPRFPRYLPEGARLDVFGPLPGSTSRRAQARDEKGGRQVNSISTAHQLHIARFGPVFGVIWGAPGTRKPPASAELTGGCVLVDLGGLEPPTSALRTLLGAIPTVPTVPSDCSKALQFQRLPTQAIAGPMVAPLPSCFHLNCTSPPSERIQMHLNPRAGIQNPRNLKFDVTVRRPPISIPIERGGT